MGTSIPSIGNDSMASQSGSACSGGWSAARRRRKRMSVTTDVPSRFNASDGKRTAATRSAFAAMYSRAAPFSLSSHFSLDKLNGAAREYIAAKADLVAAVRLPSEALKREGTSVVTDILFLRRRAADQPPEHADPDWLAIESLPIEGIDVPINRYFLNHPYMVLGTWTRKDTLYGEGCGVAADGNLAEQLAGAVGDAASDGKKQTLLEKV